MRQSVRDRLGQRLAVAAARALAGQGSQLFIRVGRGPGRHDQAVVRGAQGAALGKEAGGVQAFGPELEPVGPLVGCGQWGQGAQLGFGQAAE